MQTLTPLEAWADFYVYINETENWNATEIPDRDQIYKAEKARQASRLGYKRIKAILTRCAPGRYEFAETVTLKE